MLSGETQELKTERNEAPVAERFDAAMIKEALQETLYLQGLLRQGRGGWLRRICGLAAWSTRALFRPHRRDPYGVPPRIKSGSFAVNVTSIVVGGLVPALFLGLGTVLMRFSIGADASIPTYLAVIGTTIALVGWISVVLTGQSAGLRVPGAVGWAIAMALAWSTAIACISYGFGTLKLPVSVVAPLTNSNAIVAVTVRALAFGEWRSLHLPMTVGGTLLICAGATLVSLAK